MTRSGQDYARFLAGDTDGLVCLIRDYQSGLVLYLDSFTHDLTAAEELMEDTFVKLAIKKPAFYGGSSFKTWLYAIGANLARDWLRKRSRSRETSLEELPGDAASREDLERQYLRREQLLKLRRAMGSLRQEYLQVLYLTCLEGMTNAEAAKVMRKTRRQIENLHYRAKLALKAQLEKEGFVYENL